MVLLEEPKKVLESTKLLTHGPDVRVRVKTLTLVEPDGPVVNFVEVGQTTLPTELKERFETETVVGDSLG